MLKGCTRDICVNVYCLKNPNFVYKGILPEDLKARRDELWKDFKENQKYKLPDICCHTDFMDKITNTV